MRIGWAALREADREAIIGAGVVLIGTLVLVLAYGGGRSSVPGYDLKARFNKAEGISVGSPVRLSGVDVGKVVAQELDDHFRAIVTIRVGSGTVVPGDSAAVIQTDGLLGAKYIALQAGADETNLKPGEQLRYTQDSVDVRDLLTLIIAEGQAKRSGQAGGAAK